MLTRAKKSAMSTDQCLQYISQFDVSARTPEGKLLECTAQELEQEEFLLIQARRIKAYTGVDRDPLREFPVDVERCKRFASAETWLAPPKQIERNLVGLAFSGGGIRSATFGLGVLQGLAELDLLKFVDYLSTVSGGGFIGSWLATWIKRRGKPGQRRRSAQAAAQDQAEALRGFNESELARGVVGEADPEPIFHLREFSNYLSPRLNFFSGDSWTLAAIYLRNLLANQLVLLPFVAAVLLVTRLYVSLLASPPIGSERIAALASIVGFVVTLLICGIARWTGLRSWFAASIWACGVLAIITSYWSAFGMIDRFDPHNLAIFGPPAASRDSAFCPSFGSSLVVAMRTNGNASGSPDLRRGTS